MKKIYSFISLLSLAIVGMAYLYFSSLNEGQVNEKYGLNVLTQYSSMIFSFDNEKSFTDVLNRQTISDDILGKEKTKFLNQIKLLAYQDKSINELFSGKKIFIGAVPAEQNKVSLMLVTQIQSKEKKWLITLQKLHPQAIKDYYRISLNDSTFCYVRLHQNTIFMTDNEQLFAKPAPVTNDESLFAKYIRKNSHYTQNILATIYLNFQVMPALLKNILNSNLNGELSLFQKQNSFAALNYSFSSDKLLLNGYTSIDDKNNYLSIFATQTEQKSNLDMAFPDRTANYTLYAIQNLNEWSVSLAEWQKTQAYNKNMAKDIERVNDKYRLNLNQIFPIFFDKQMASLQLDNGEKIGLISVKNGDKLAQSLLDLSSEYNPEIRIFKERNILSYFFGQVFDKFPRPFYAVIDNLLIVANYPSSIQLFLNSYKNNHLLSNTADYKNFKDQISTTTTVTFYVNRTNSNTVFGRNLKAPYYRQYQSVDGFKDYSSFCYQLVGEKNRFLTNVLLLKKTKNLPIDSLML